MNDERLYCIRGATCAENTEESISRNVGELCRSLFERNSLRSENLVSIQFSVTPDLDALNPATALRNCDTGLDTSRTALFCSAEPCVKNMLPRAVRVMISAYMPRGFSPEAVYINGAQVLRPDLSGNPS